MTAEETEEDGECLYENQIRNVEKIRLRECILQAETILVIEVDFGAAKVGHNLIAGRILVRLD
jgi:hypothetical protein